MSDIAKADPYARSQMFKRTVGFFLTVMHRILPAPAYKAVYIPLFAMYRTALRLKYRMRIALASLSGKQAQAAKMKAVDKIMPYSLVGTPGLEHTYELAQVLVDADIEGSFVECGVAQGGCAALLAGVASNGQLARECWFFDSYEGLPDPTEDDFEDGKTGQHIRPLPKGSCLGTYEQVASLMYDKLEFSRDEVHLVKGWFQDTLPVTKEKIGKIALLRVDGDWYDSTMTCLNELYAQVVPGGQVIIDDYHSCHGAHKATNEFIETHAIETKLEPDGRGGASFFKPQVSHQTEKAA